jgi:hypothetical protein
MNEPPPLMLARQIAPDLSGLTWAIGGSTLLHNLGLVDSPNDLDLVVTEEDFTTIAARLFSVFGSHSRPESKYLASAQFARFQAYSNCHIDIMASIAVRQGARLQPWHFDPASVRIRDGLPWMRASDWLELYRLFDRPERVALLEDYLAAQGRVK